MPRLIFTSRPFIAFHLWRLVPLVLLSLVSFRGNAQKAQAKLDSLTRLYATTTSDAGRFELLKSIILSLEAVSKFPAMLDSANVMIHLADKLKSGDLKAEGYTRKASALRRLSRNKEAKSTIDTAFGLLTSKTKPSERLGLVFTMFTLIHMSLGKPDSSIYYGEKAIVIDSVLNSKDLSNSFNNIAIAYLSKSNYLAANMYFFKALRMAERDNQSVTIGRCLINIGVVYMQLEDFVLSRKYFQLCYDFRKKSGSPQAMAAVLGNMSTVEMRSKNYQKAISLCKEALYYCTPIKYYPNIVTAYTNMANSFSSLHQTDSAVFYIKKAIDISETHQVYSNLASTYGALGDIYYASGQLKEAKGVFLKEMDYNILYPSHHSPMHTYSRLADVCEKLGEYEGALTYLKKYKNLNDSLLNETNKKNQSKMDLEFQTEKKDKELAQQKLDLSRQQLSISENNRNLAAQSFALLLQKEESGKQATQNELLKTRNQNANLAITNQEKQLAFQTLEAKTISATLELEKHSNELQSKDLQEQINVRNGLLFGALCLAVIGWLVFNSFRLRRKLELQQVVLNQRKQLSADLHDDIGATLSSISIYTEAIKNKLKNDEPQKVMELVNKIGENARETISTLGDIVWNINPQNDSPEKLFIRMESTATMVLSAQNARLEFEVDPRLADFDFSMEAKQNLYLIFKETINNTVKYALASVVQLHIKKVENSLLMEIADNGTGFDTRQKTEGNGLGNIKKRVEDFGGKFTISSSSAGTSTTVQIPIPALVKI